MIPCPVPCPTPQARLCLPQARLKKHADKWLMVQQRRSTVPSATPQPLRSSGTDVQCELTLRQA